ncbi:hypothetical protein GXP67_25395 [Rhodocytophaga rosea]|uniref:Uncharacterized protein n=1 Tax=Rhodocytophaga rosea TaxID=2704465 RepID=A0A6C0GPG4_9BACT|nr:hypothetical protein [Rhodocytophaga rosea]QHT69744.1 hypothetical protein GXP67_25395 [Rhodocytophaga rosea]
MKISYFLYIACMCLISLLPACHLMHNNDLEVTVSESEDSYELAAYFDESKTSAIQSYINRELRPNSVFGSVTDKLNITTMLDDKTTFHINSSPGKLKITLDKKENSKASYYRIKKIGEGVHSILVQKN